jgi:hypothetical protein
MKPDTPSRPAHTTDTPDPWITPIKSFQVEVANAWPWTASFPQKEAAPNSERFTGAEMGDKRR